MSDRPATRPYVESSLGSPAAPEPTVADKLRAVSAALEEIGSWLPSQNATDHVRTAIQSLGLAIEATNPGENTGIVCHLCQRRIPKKEASIRCLRSGCPHMGGVVPAAQPVQP